MARPIRVKHAVMPLMPHKREIKMQKMSSRASTHTQRHTDTLFSIYSKCDCTDFTNFNGLFFFHISCSFFALFPPLLSSYFLFSVVLSCLQALSVQNNSQGVLAMESSGSSYSSLNGIRILSLLWIISGHTMQLSAWSNLGESEGEMSVSMTITVTVSMTLTMN